MKPLRDFLELIKFEHTIFALPFAYLGMLLAAGGFPPLDTFLWITLAMASARTVAMAFNRIADRHIDAHNPRTAQRPLVTGAISLRIAWGGLAISILVLTLAAWQLGPLPLRLAPVALLFLLGYSYTKHFTWLSHFVLGFTDGLAPVGAWVAVRGSLFTPADLPAWILLAVVTLWIGGFDLIYACQDVPYDRLDRLQSIPARFGIAFALRLSSVCHLLTVLLLGWLGIVMGLSWPYWLGLLIVAGMLIYEHRLVHPDDLSRLDLAFFNMNSYISITLFIAILAALLLGCRLFSIPIDHPETYYSPTATITATPTEPALPEVTPSSEQLEIFEQLWRIVRDDYLYPDFNGLDWDAIHAEYRHYVESGLQPEEFYATLDEMIARLGDDHSIYLSPAAALEEEVEYAGENDYVGIGVYTSPVLERRRVTIIVTFPGGPAEQAGLKSHDSILSVDGQPIIDENGIRADLLRGPQDTTITLEVVTPGETPRRVQVTRSRIQGALPVPYQELQSPSGKRIGYILLPSFNDETIDDQVGKALETLAIQAPLDGLILDLRQNSGGADNVARGALSYFTSGDVGYFTNRQDDKRWWRIESQDVNGSSELTLVVLISGDTVSFGEIFAGVLQDSGRAILIGTPTEGNVELLWRYDFKDGSRAWIARETFRPRNNPEQDWERNGVLPDLLVESNWDEVTLSSDPVIQSALTQLEQY